MPAARSWDAWWLVGTLVASGALAYQGSRRFRELRQSEASSDRLRAEAGARLEARS